MLRKKITKISHGKASFTGSAARKEEIRRRKEEWTARLKKVDGSTQKCGKSSVYRRANFDPKPPGLN